MTGQSGPRAALREAGRPAVDHHLHSSLRRRDVAAGAGAELLTGSDPRGLLGAHRTVREFDSKVR